LNYQPSRLELPSSSRTVQLRFAPPVYELILRDESERICERTTITGAQLRQVTLDMHPVECGSIRLTYAARHVLFEIDGKLFVRVLDVDVMKLHDFASAGFGESVSPSAPYGLH